MVKGFHHVDEVEARLVRNMEKEGIPWNTITKITGRSSETISKILHPPKGIKKAVIKGQPRKIGDAKIKEVLESMDKLQKKNHPKGKEVTADMVIAAAGVNASEKTLLRAFHEKDIQFYRLKERQTLTDDDIKERRAWVKTRKGRRAATWVRKPHAIIDNKHWQLFVTGAGRAHEARRAIRGVYQQRATQRRPTTR